jgi:hypothetical protein
MFHGILANCIFHPNPASDYDTNSPLEIIQAALGNEQISVALIASNRPLCAVSNYV